MTRSSEFDSFWDELIPCIRDGTVVPVVGRELSTLEVGGRQVRLDQWAAERLAEDMGLSLNADVRNPLNALASAHIADGKRLQDIYAALHNLVAGSDELSPSSSLTQLARIQPFQLFLSTTFDDLLSKALDQVRFNGASRTRSGGFSLKGPRVSHADLSNADQPFVYHLFGQLSARQSYVITDEDLLEYIHVLHSESDKLRELLDVLHDRQLLFIGSGFSGWLARFFVRIAKPSRLWLAQEKTDFLADDAARQDANLVDFFQRFGTGTKIYQDGGAVEFVDALAARWQEEGDRPTPPESTMQHGAIFLSYASEDRPIVEEIGKTLRSIGLDVWFDRDDLRGGDKWRDRIRQNIRGARLFLPIVSQSTLATANRFFREEWTYALDTAPQVVPGRKFIVPVTIDSTRLDHPNIPERLQAYQGVAWTQSEDTRAFANQIRTIYRASQIDDIAR